MNSLEGKFTEYKNHKLQQDGNIYSGKLKKQEGILLQKGRKELNWKEKLLNFHNQLSTEWNKLKIKRLKSRRKKLKNNLWKYYDMLRDSFGEVQLKWEK